jgi:hypothetical protein
MLPPPQGMLSEEFLLGDVHTKSAGWASTDDQPNNNKIAINNLIIFIILYDFRSIL